ncbi:MAG: alpha/beta hydrolase [Acidobacteriota bacterium]|nr:alpha/beta hydrolase [Acidobacteriota bacterium]
MRIFLLHGMGRSIASMAYLAWRLRQIGHQPTLFGYLVMTTDLQDIADRFAQKVQQVMAEDDARLPAGESPPSYAVIGHSLGNVITRLASPHLVPGFSRFVMLAPPNHNPTVAGQLEGNKIFHFFTGDAGRKLASEDFYDQLPVPDVPSIIVAGTGGPRDPRLHLGDSANDGILTVEETRLDGIPLVEVNAIHTFLMNRTDVFELIRDFLAAADEDDPAAAVLAERASASVA